MQFSIIIPAKNEINNFKRVLPQYQVLRGKFEYEVIVADGKSEDGSIEYARTMVDRVEIKTELERETIATGRNRGAAVARGDILVFVDAGVMIPDVVDFFGVIVNHFRDEKIVGAVPRVEINPREALLSDKLVHTAVNGIIRFRNVMGWGAGKGETQIVRHSAFKKIGGYNGKLVAAEDNDLFIRLAKIGKVLFLNELVVYDNPSRYRALGYPRVISQWALNWLSMRIRGKSYTKEWKRVG